MVRDHLNGTISSNGYYHCEGEGEGGRGRESEGGIYNIDKPTVCRDEIWYTTLTGWYIIPVIPCSRREQGITADIPAAEGKGISHISSQHIVGLFIINHPLNDLYAFILLFRRSSEKNFICSNKK